MSKPYNNNHLQGVQPSNIGPSCLLYCPVLFLRSQKGQSLSWILWSVTSTHQFSRGTSHSSFLYLYSLRNPLRPTTYRTKGSYKRCTLPIIRENIVKIFHNIREILHGIMVLFIYLALWSSIICSWRTTGMLWIRMRNTIVILIKKVKLVPTLTHKR